MKHIPFTDITYLLSFSSNSCCCFLFYFLFFFSLNQSMRKAGNGISASGKLILFNESFKWLLKGTFYMNVFFLLCNEFFFLVEFVDFESFLYFILQFWSIFIATENSWNSDSSNTLWIVLHWLIHLQLWLCTYFWFIIEVMTDDWLIYSNDLLIAIITI